MKIEQAIFTSIQSERFSGYQIAAQSPGLSTSQLERFAAWAPTHDALLPCVELASLNFNQLDECCWLLSRTSTAGAEYSGRRGQRVYTHALFLDRDTMGRFAWHPFRVYEAVCASGRLCQRADLPTTLSAFKLPGRAAIVTTDALQQMEASSERDEIFALLQALVAGVDQRTFVVQPESLASLLDQALSLLPVECRQEVSFSTGLRDSQQRQFGLMLAPEEPQQQRQLARRRGVHLCELHSETKQQQGWATLVARCLDEQGYEELITMLGESESGLQLQDLAQM